MKHKNWLVASIVAICPLFVFGQETVEVSLFLKLDDVIQHDMDDVKMYFIAENDEDDKDDDDTIDLNFKGYKFSVDSLPGDGIILFTFRDYEIDIPSISMEKLENIERIEIEMWTTEKSIKKQMKEFGLPKQKCDKLNLLAKYTLLKEGHGKSSSHIGITVECFYFK